MKKLVLNVLLAMILLFALGTGAYAESGDGDVTADDFIEDDLDLSNLGTYQITKNTTVGEGVKLTFYGTELQIDPGVTLTILGNAEGEAITTEGTVRVQGNTARLRTNSFFRETDSGTLEINHYATVELSSSSVENNAYLDPNMDIAITNGGYVTFGYYVSSEQHLRSLLESLDYSNPMIFMELQIYSGITLSDDLVLPNRVSLHTDYNWGNGQGFTIPTGKTLTIPENSGFAAFSSAIDIQGTLVNRGYITLGKVGDSENPGIYNLTLEERGAYSGNGMIIVETLDQPASYLVGFEAYRWDERWRDTYSGRTGYQLLTIQNLDTLTLDEDWTIPSDLEVNADTVVVPSGKTLTVQGWLNCRELIVSADAEINASGRGGFGYSGYVKVTQSLTLDGRIRINDGSTLKLSPLAWNNSIPEHVEFGTDGSSRVEIQGAANSPEEFSVLYEAMENMVIPEDESWRYSRSFEVLFPWTPEDGFVIPREINFTVRNDGEGERGSLTVPAGSTFTLEQGAYLSMRAAELTVNGRIQNEGRISLMTFDSGPNGTMSSFTLGSDAEYTGSGVIEVASYQTDAMNYLVGFDPDKLIKEPGYEGSTVTNYRYVDKNALFEEFKAVCESENPPQFYDKLQRLGNFIIPESLTIPEEMYVSANGTTFVLAAAENAGSTAEPITLRIGGNLNCDGFEIPEGARVETGENIYMQFTNMTLDGSFRVGQGSSINVWLDEWDDADTALAAALTDPSHVSFDGEYAKIEFSANLMSNNDQLQTVLALMADPVHYFMNLAIKYPCILSNDLCIPSGVQLRIENDEQDGQNGIMVTEGTSLTLQPGSTLIFNGTQLAVSGELVNNGTVSLHADWAGNSNLVFENGGSYSGGGIIQIRANDDLKSHIIGIDRARIITVREESGYGNGEYRIVNGEVNVLSDGDTLSLVTSQDAVFPDQYSANYIFTPAETGLYTFRFSFAGDPAPEIHWDSSSVAAINGANVERSFDTDDPESMVIRAALKDGEGYEFVLAHDAAFGAQSVNVSVSAVTGGLNDILSSLAGTYYESYDLRETTVIGAGETVTVPENVWLNVYTPLTVESGGSLVINASGISMEQGSSLTVLEGGMLELRDHPENGAIAQIQLNGGSIYAADNTVTYGENSQVFLPCWMYGNFEAGRAAADGIPDERISAQVSVYNADELFGLNGYSNLWEDLAGYRYVTFNLYGTELQLAVNKIPEHYRLCVYSGSSVEIPENNTVDLNGSIELNRGTLINQGILNVNGMVYFLDIDSIFQNNGTITVSGMILTNYDEYHNAGTIQNYGTLNILGEGMIDSRIRVLNNIVHYENCAVLPAATENIGEEAFAGILAQEVILPGNIESIGSRAFAESYNLRQIVIPNGDAQISADAFEFCYDYRIVAPAGGKVETFALNAGIPFLPME